MLPICSLSGSLALKCQSYYQKHIDDPCDSWGAVSRAAGTIATAALIYVDVSICLLAIITIVPLCFMNRKEHLYNTAELVIAAVLAPFFVAFACQSFGIDPDKSYFNLIPTLKTVLDYAKTFERFANNNAINNIARYIENHLNDPTISSKEKTVAILWNAGLINKETAIQLLDINEITRHSLNLILFSNLTPAQKRSLVVKMRSIVNISAVINLIPPQERYILIEHLLALRITIHIDINVSKIKEVMFHFVRQGHIRIVECLLNNGAERYFSDSLSALLECAIINRNDEMARLLVQFGAEILLKDIAHNLPRQEFIKIIDMYDAFNAKKQELADYQKTLRKDLVDDALNGKLTHDPADFVAQFTYPDDVPLP